jgi:large subunit ribosomal protein L9
MEVILLERVEKLGQMGDVVKVKSGYARNFLLPQRKAMRATAENLEAFEGRRVQLEADNLQRREEAEAAAGKLGGLSVVLIRQAGETGQLYGSVSARDLAEALAEAGATVDRNQVQLEKAIKVLGLHPVHIRLHPEVVVTVSANVARSEEEARTQASEGHVVSAEDQREAEEAAVEAVIAEVEEAEEAEAALEEEQIEQEEDAAAVAEDSAKDSTEPKDQPEEAAAEDSVEPEEQPEEAPAEPEEQPEDPETAKKS